MKPLGSRRERVVVVFRAPTAARFLDAGLALADAGITRLEFTLTSDGALGAIASAKTRLPHVDIGCGTARSVADVEAARDAGADFVVSQYLDRALVEAARRMSIAYVPGALTPGEIVAAAQCGPPVVKVSPIGPVGGAAYLRELVGPLPDIPMFPTGGVRPEDAGGYFAAGAAFVGLSGLLLQDALTDGDLVDLAARAAAMLSTLDSTEGTP